MERKAFLIAKAWVYFGYNYSSPEEFIRYIVDKTSGRYDFNHLLDKFDCLYNGCGSNAVMNRFFAELTSELQSALVDYAIHEYAPKGLCLTDDDKELLGI